MHDRVVLRPGEQLAGDGVRRQGREALGGLVLGAHGHPGVGDDDVGAGDRGGGVALEAGRAAGRRGDVGGRGHDVGTGLVALGRAHHDVQAGGGAGEQPGVAHVAGAVADEGGREPGEAALVLADGEQVGEQLAGVEVVGERVDHRHAGVGGHRVDLALGAGAPDDDRRLPAEHPGDVLDRLALADAGEAAVDGHGVPAQLGDAGAERRLGAQRLLVEDHRDGARAAQRLLLVRRPLELGGEGQHLGLLGRGEVVVAEEVPGHACAPGVSPPRRGWRARRRGTRRRPPR